MIEQKSARIILIALMGLFLISTTSCSLFKKSCHPPCPTWDKKKR